MSFIYDMIDTWNNGATTFTAIKMNITDTASAAGSLLMDLQVGGVRKLSATKDTGAYFSLNLFEQRNGTAAQRARTYNTFTDASNGEWLEFGANALGIGANTFAIGTTNNGTGLARDFYIQSSSRVLFQTTGAINRWLINTTGNFEPVTNGAVGIGAAGAGISKLYIDYTNTATVGAVTINKAAGRVNIAAAGTSVVVTNSLVTAASHVMVVMSTADATGRVTSVVPAAGSFTINTVATTAQASFDFFVINAD